jgi:hypothetical protein
LYLLPYVAVSYYERYAFPLLAAKVLLVIWGVDRLLTALWPRKRTQAQLQQKPQPARKGKPRQVVPVSG